MIHDYFIQGDRVGKESNLCILAISHHENADQQLWYLGTIFMKLNFIVFDKSTNTKHNQNYLQIGIGNKVQDDPIEVDFLDLSSLNLS